jgi:hypothetical protein
MRMYEPAWIRLKSNPELPLIISAHARFHARIFKAIQKEKWKDTVYHLAQDSRGYTTKLSRESKGDVLTIRLEVIPNLENLF